MYYKLFGQSIYTKLEPKQRLPYDATCPIPLCFLLEAVRFNHDTKWLIGKCKEHIPNEYHTSGMKEEERYYSLLESIDFSNLFDIVKTMVLPTMIPTIILPKDLLIDKNDNSPDDSTLFVRLNRQGTQIDGEELIYSMFKSACPQTKDLVECLGMNIIAPSKVITLTSRLVLSEDNYVANLNLAQFRKLVQDKAFIAKMEAIIGNETHSPIKEIINKAIDILKFDCHSS